MDYNDAIAAVHAGNAATNEERQGSTFIALGTAPNEIYLYTWENTPIGPYSPNAYDEGTTTWLKGSGRPPGN